MIDLEITPLASVPVNLKIGKGVEGEQTCYVLRLDRLQVGDFTYSLTTSGLSKEGAFLQMFEGLAAVLEDDLEMREEAIWAFKSFLSTEKASRYIEEITRLAQDPDDHW